MVVNASARLRYVSIPPRKMRLVANMVKGLPVQKALDILNFTPKIAAQHLAKTLKSAAANALSAEGTDVVKAEDLTVKNITVDAAPTAKRIRFQSMGRVFRYRKRFCHLTVMLQGETEEAPARKFGKKAAASRGSRASAKAKAGDKSAAKSRKTSKKTSAKSDKPRKAVEAKVKKSATKSVDKTEKKTNDDNE